MNSICNYRKHHFQFPIHFFGVKTKDLPGKKKKERKKKKWKGKTAPQFQYNCVFCLLLFNAHYARVHIRKFKVKENNIFFK